MMVLEEKKENKVESPTSEAKTSEKKVKKNDTKLEIEKLKAEIAERDDKLLRLAAEFDNFKRRTDKEKFSTAEFTSAKLLKKLLPVFDNVDRANKADKESAEYSKGVELIVKMLSESVAELGLVEIGAVGDDFDPNLHEAVMHIEDENFGENKICNVLQKGYKFGDIVIRPAMVQVAN